MKERIKQFYQEHPDGCHAVASGLAILGSIFALRQAHGMKIDRAGLWHSDEGAQLITIRLKNGSTRTFSKMPDK